jgi:hypothetical protein
MKQLKNTCNSRKENILRKIQVSHSYYTVIALIITQQFSLGLSSRPDSAVDIQLGIIWHTLIPEIVLWPK